MSRILTACVTSELGEISTRRALSVVIVACASASLTSKPGECLILFTAVTAYQQKGIYGWLHYLSDYSKYVGFFKILLDLQFSTVYNLKLNIYLDISWSSVEH